MTDLTLTDERIQASLRERARLREIAELRLTDPDLQPLLRDRCERAAAELGLPIGLVTIVLDEAQFFAAHVGIGGWMGDAEGTPSEWAFCRFGVATKQPFVVDDATTHALVKDNPLVTEDGLRCYAGIPLITSRGHALGSLCVAGAEARTFTEDDVNRLREFAADVVAQLERRRRAGAA